MTDETAAVAAVAHQVAAAIGRRDVAGLRGLLAPGFSYRAHGGDAADAEAFLAGIAQIPGEIRSVGLEQLTIDTFPNGAVATGVQHAQVVVDGQVVHDRRGFVDWFVKHAGAWRIQAAVDFPLPSPA